MAAQLARDGKLTADMELGLIFYTQDPEDLQVVGQVRQHGQVLFELKGNKGQLAAVATQLALAKLPPAVRGQLGSSAAVRWRLVHFADEEESFDRCMADVEFQSRALPA